MNWFVTVLKRYAQFSGRASRSEYWYFVLIYILASVLLGFLDGFLGTYSYTADVGLLSGILILGLLIPSLAVSVRRLHDTNKSGWWLLIGLIPLIGGIVLLVFTCQKSDPQPNQYGTEPGEMLW